MKLDLEICRTMAIRSGLPLQFIFKEFHLMNILSKISASSHANSLALKGGTALNKAYLGGMQRFSEDVDFDLISREAKHSALSFSKELASIFDEYTIDEFRKVRDTIQFYCKYETPLGGKDNVRIDISPKLLITAKPLEGRKIESGFIQASVTGIKIYSIEDLTARKLSALSSRDEGKDVYDVSMALPLCSTNTLKEAISCMLKSEMHETDVNAFISKLYKHLKKSDIIRLRNITNPFIPVSKRPNDWGELKNSLLLKIEEL